MRRQAAIGERDKRNRGDENVWIYFVPDLFGNRYFVVLFFARKIPTGSPFTCKLSVLCIYGYSGIMDLAACIRLDLAYGNQN